jgi:hypothetical protein
MPVTRPRGLAAACAASVVFSGALDHARAQHVVLDDLNRFGVDDFEITPDGRFAVGRENTQLSNALVYDLAAGTPAVVRSSFPTGYIGGPAQDSIALTNTRAAMLGSELLIVDLAAAALPVIARHDVGVFPRDLVITPNERFLVVRGGETLPPYIGGQFVFDLATGAQLGTHPGEPHPYFSQTTAFDVDSVVADDRYAVFTSAVDLGGTWATRVTVWELAPVGGGAPAVVFETTAANDLDGTPNDIAMAPNGAFVAVRSEFEVGYVDLAGVAPGLVWTRPLFNMPGPFGLSVMDSIEVTDDRIATLSRWSNGGVGAQIDVFDPAGNQYYQLLFGDPHDLTFTPSGDRLVARTSTQVLLYDLTTLPTSGIVLAPLDFSVLGSTHTSYGAGLDSIVATDERAVAVARVNETTELRVFDITQDRLDVTIAETILARPIDVDLAPDHTSAWVSCFTHVLGIDLRVDAVTFEHDPTTGGGYPWCDGVAVSDGHVVAFGYTVNPPAQSQLPALSGWVTVIERFTAATAFCPSNPNSTGEAAALFATGSSRASANDLRLWVQDATPDTFGFFFYGDQTPTPTAFGDGFLCVTGQLGRFPVVVCDAMGVAGQVVDSANLPPGGGALTAGSTWHFQFVHRDLDPVVGRWNTSQGLSILFEN